MLEALRSILRAEGRLSLTLFRGAPNTLSKEGYRRGFGSLVRAYDLAGYNSPLKATVIHRAEIRKVRRELMENLVRLFPGSIVLLATNRGAVFYRPVCLSPTRSESEFYSFHSFLDCAAIQVGVGESAEDLKRRATILCWFLQNTHSLYTPAPGMVHS